MNSDTKFETLNKAIYFFNRGDFKRALPLFKNCLINNPEDTKIYFYVGRILLYLKDYEGALKHFKICEECGSDKSAASYYYGRTLIHTGDYIGAIERLQRSSSSIVASDFFLGLCYHKTREYESALAHLDKLPQFIKNRTQCKTLYAAIHYGLGIKFYSENKINDAGKHLRISQQFYHSDLTKLQLGVIYIELKKYAEAATCFEGLTNVYVKKYPILIILVYLYNLTDNKLKLEKTLKLMKKENFKANEYSLKKTLAFTLYRNRKYKEAVPILLSLYKMNKYDIPVLYSLAMSRKRLGFNEKAMNCFNLIFGITTKNIRINNSYMLFLIDQKLYDKVEEFFVIIYSKNYFDNKTLLLYFYAMVFNREYCKAAGFLSVLESLFGGNQLFLEAAAEYYLRGGNVEKAADYYYKLYNICPADQNTALSLVNLFNMRNLKELSLYYLSKMFESDKSNLSVIYYYGYFLIKLSYFDTAEKILNDSPLKDSKIYYLLGDLYERQNKYGKAIACYRRSFRLSPLYTPTQYKLLRHFYKRNKLKHCLDIISLMDKSAPDFHRKDLYSCIIHVKALNYHKAISKLVCFIKKSNFKVSGIVITGYIYLLYKCGQVVKARQKSIEMIKKKGGIYMYIINALCSRKDYDLDRLKSIEKKIFSDFKDFEITKEYYNKFIAVNPVSGERSDIGLRLF